LPIDTGNSDLLVPSSRAEDCSQPGGCPSGAYSASYSSTYELIAQAAFLDTYADGSLYQGDYFTDVVSIGGLTIDKGDFFMGVANVVNSSIPGFTNVGSGIIGLGYQTLASTGDSTALNGTLPPTMVSALVASGTVDRQA
jgi:hypothetical protein